jgi:hypothetical protein
MTGTNQRLDPTLTASFRNHMTERYPTSLRRTPRYTRVQPSARAETSGRPLKVGEHEDAEELCTWSRPEGGRALLKLTEGTEAGRVAAELWREDCLDAVFWGSKPTLRLRHPCCAEGVG